MATATDNFNRADFLNGLWTHQTGQWNIISNQLDEAGVSADSISVHNGSPLDAVGANQYAQVVVVSLVGTNDQAGAGVAVRWSTTTKTGYWMVVNSATSNNVSIHRFDSGGNASLLGQATQAFAAGDVIRLEVSGTSIVGKRAAAASPTSFSTIIGPFTNSDVASGFPGLALSTDMTTVQLDNWEGGDLAAAGRTTRNTRAQPLGIRLGMDRFLSVG